MPKVSPPVRAATGGRIVTVMLTTRTRSTRVAAPAPALTAAAFGLTLLVLVIYWSCSGRDAPDRTSPRRARRRRLPFESERVVVCQLLERPFAAPLRMQTLGGSFTLVVRRRVLYDYRPELYPYWFN